jgi:hypothetical protein
MSLTGQLRELEATENLAVHFKTELEKLKEDLEKSKQETEAYERVSEAYDKVAVSIYEELQETVSRLSMGVDDTKGKNYLRNLFPSLRTSKEKHRT